MAFLVLNDIHKSFGLTQVLKNIGIDLAEGEFLVLVGPSGCGKSTLLNIIAGLEEPTRGTLMLAGKDVTHAEPAARNIAMVFQSYALYPNMSVAENIAFPLEMRGLDKVARAKKVNEVAKVLQIENLLDRKPKQLSGGQRQRVAIGRALAREPQLFLFDEPLSNLDAKLRVDMRSEIKRLHQRTGVTTIYVTHDQVEAMTLGTRIAVLRGGEMMQLGSPLQLYSDPENLFVAQFIGSPAINTFSARVLDVHTLALSNGHVMQLPKALPLTLGQTLTAAVRPEHVRLDGVGELGSATITQVDPTGPEDYLELDWEGIPLSLRVPGQSHWTLGATVKPTLKLEHVLLFEGESGRRIR